MAVALGGCLMVSEDFSNRDDIESQDDMSKSYYDIFGQDCPEFKNQIDSPKSIISFDNWYLQLNQKLDDLKHTIDENFPDLYGSLEFVLSIKNILHIKNCTLPFAGIILGSPSSSKTIGLELLRDA